MRQTLTDGSIDPDKPYYSTFDISPTVISDIILIHGKAGISSSPFSDDHD